MANGCYAIAEYWNVKSFRRKGHLSPVWALITYQLGICHRRGCLIAESQDRKGLCHGQPGMGARAKPLTGDVTSGVHPQPPTPSRMARPFQFKGMDEGNTRAFLFFSV